MKKIDKKTLLLPFIALCMLVACSEKARDTKKETAVALVSDNLKKTDNKVASTIEQKSIIPTPAASKPPTPPTKKQIPKIPEETVDQNKVETTTAKYTSLTGDDQASIDARSAWWKAPSLEFKKAIVEGINSSLNDEYRQGGEEGSGETPQNAVSCPSDSSKQTCLPQNANLNDAQIKYILKFPRYLHISSANVDLNALTKNDLEVLRSMTEIKYLIFGFKNTTRWGTGNLRGNFTQRVANYLPTGLKYIAVIGSGKFTATNLSSLTHLKDIWLTNNGEPNGPSKDIKIPSHNVTLPSGASFNPTSGGFF